MPIFGPQGLKLLPSTLLHLTIWTSELDRAPGILPGTPEFLSEFPFAESFPKLETLRICAASSAGPEDPPYNLDLVPTTVRTLSLIFPGATSMEQMASAVVQPIGHQNGARTVDQEKADFHLDYSATDADRASWKYRFPLLEYFEWGTTELHVSPRSDSMNPAKLPPLLKHYIQNNCSLFPMATLVQPSHEEVEQANKKPSKSTHSSPLQTVILVSGINESRIRALPPTIKTLALPSGINWNGTNFAKLFPTLRSLRCSNAFDVNKVTLPNTLTSLEWGAFKCDVVGLFTLIAPPASLTRLAVIIEEEKGLFTNLPATIRHLSITGAAQGTYLSTQVFPFLPKRLASLRLKVRNFAPEYLAMLPRGLEELDITAESMLLHEWKPGGVWDNEPIPFDISGLPPTLRSLRLRVEKHGIMFPSSFFGELPRTLRSFEVTETLIDAIQAPEASSSAEASSSSSSSTSPRKEKEKKKKGLLDTISGWFKSEDAPAAVFYTDADIARSLQLLPEDCWVATRFKARIPGDSVRNPAPQPAGLARSVKLQTPGGITLSYTLGVPLIRDYFYFDH